MTTFTIHSFDGEFICVNNTTQEKTFSVFDPLCAVITALQKELKAMHIDFSLDIQGGKAASLSLVFDPMHSQKVALDYLAKAMGTRVIRGPQHTGKYEDHYIYSHFDWDLYIAVARYGKGIIYKEKTPAKAEFLALRLRAMEQGIHINFEETAQGQTSIKLTYSAEKYTYSDVLGTLCRFFGFSIINGQPS